MKAQPHQPPTGFGLKATTADRPAMTANSSDAASRDPYLWLEDVDGARALDWARERNAETERALEKRADYDGIRASLLAIYDSKDRIARVRRRGDRFYNFWQDEKHKRGIVRRASLAGFRNNDVPWETVIDLDALAADENENWTWHGMQCLGPDYRRCLVSLSRGGADAAVVREFDSVDKRFVEGGFALPEAKSDVAWVDADSVYVATDFGAGSLTASGYPRIVKRWRRGTPLAMAETLFEAAPDDVAAGVSVDRTPGFERTVFSRLLDTRRSKRFLLADGKLEPVDVPDDARVDFMRDTMLLELRSDLTLGERTFAAGSLLGADAEAWRTGKRSATALFTPTPTRSLAGWQQTRGGLLLDVLDNVAGRLEVLTKHGTQFSRRGSTRPFPGRSASARSTTRSSTASRPRQASRRLPPPRTDRSPSATGSATSISSRPTRSRSPAPKTTGARPSRRGRRSSMRRACTSTSSSRHRRTAPACRTSSSGRAA